MKNEPNTSDGASDVPSVAPRQTETMTPGMIRLQCKGLQVIADHRRKHHGDQTVYEDIIGAIKTITALLRENAELTALAAKQREALEVAQLWLCNSAPVAELDGPKPLPLIAKVLALTPPAALAPHLREVGEKDDKIKQLEEKVVEWRDEIGKNLFSEVEQRNKTIATQAKELAELRDLELGYRQALELAPCICRDLPYDNVKERRGPCKRCAAMEAGFQSKQKHMRATGKEKP